MESKKQKQKNDHVIIVTSDAIDANVRQFRIKPWLLQAMIVIFCVVVGAVIGYFINEDKIREVANRKTQEQKEIVIQLEEVIVGLEEEIALRDEKILELEAEIGSLNDKIELLSETVNQKTEIEKELTAKIEQQAIPTEYPLTGSAVMETQTANAGDPICIFTASKETTVVATASGTVTAINEDAEYGNSVWVDHGNGYISIYRNKGTVNVKLEDTVAKGTTIFMIGEDNTRFGYQIMKDEQYINPMDMLNISG